MFVIQATNNLSDERAEFLINDRLSVVRFLGLGLEDRVPDARTIWLFREKLTHGRGDQEIIRAVRCPVESGISFNSPVEMHRPTVLVRLGVPTLGPSTLGDVAVETGPFVEFRVVASRSAFCMQ